MRRTRRTRSTAQGAACSCSAPGSWRRRRRSRPAWSARRTPPRQPGSGRTTSSSSEDIILVRAVGSCDLLAAIKRERSHTPLARDVHRKPYLRQLHIAAPSLAKQQRRPCRSFTTLRAVRRAPPADVPRDREYHGKFEFLSKSKAVTRNQPIARRSTRK